MKNISDHDLSQMDEIWQANLAEPTVRSLLKRTRDELRVARDRLNQNPDVAAELNVQRFGRSERVFSSGSVFFRFSCVFFKLR